MPPNKPLKLAAAGFSRARRSARHAAWQFTRGRSLAAIRYAATRMKNLAIAALVAASGGTSDAEWVRGRAQVVTWSHEKRVVLLCSSRAAYQLGAFTSTAEGIGAREVERWLAAEPGPVLVELVGFPASLPSSWEPAPGVSGVLSVGSIKPVARGSCS